MVEVVIGVAAKVAEYLVVPIARPFSYMWNNKSNVEDLKSEVEKLKGTRDSVQRLVEVAANNGEETMQNVKIWQDKANQIIEMASEVVEDYFNNANKECCKGFSCPNLMKRYQCSKKAAGNLKDDVVRLVKEPEGFGPVSYRTIPEPINLQPSEGYVAFVSRKAIVKDIIDSLRDPDVNIVGIHGIGGVGKTTLAKDVAREAKHGKLFDKIVFVEVSKSPDIKIIQGVIADNLGLRFTQESISGRANRLRDQLKKVEKILLILDNVWESIVYEKVGIPFRNDHKGLKLLLTTRSNDVLTNQMDSQRNFHIETLNDADAWSLFKSTAGMCVEQSDLKSIAPKVAKKCGGLPVAIVTIAKALKNKGEGTWRSVLHELKHPSSKSFQEIAKEVYTCIKLSYDYLDTEELKEIFLLCSRVGCTHDASVRDLFRYGLGLGLFESFNTIEEALCKVDDLVKRLKDNSLLIDAPKSALFGIPPENERFAVHVVVRYVALSIASSWKVVTDDVIPRSWMKKDALKTCTSITLHNIDELPQNLKLACPQLKFLYVKLKDSFWRFPHNFFTGMLSLQVLHLIEIDLRPLPNSISCLINLQTLCLDQCKLEDIAIIENIEKLEILSFRGCQIKKMPEQMHHLTRLRLLDLSDCSTLSVIPPKVMSNLTELEALYMGNTSIQWEVGIKELEHLHHLTLLEMHIPDAKISKGLLSSKLERYRIFIGDNWTGSDWNAPSKTSRILKLKLNSNEDRDIISQLKSIRELELFEVPGAKNLLDDLDRTGFPELKHLRVQYNDTCLYIVDSKQSVSCDALPPLESLSLRYLDGLEKICNGPLRDTSFLQLKTIEVGFCQKLNNIILLVTAERVLPQLQKLSVYYCGNIEEIFAVEGRQDESNNTEVGVHEIKFSRLRILKLTSLRRLKSFCFIMKSVSPLQLTSETIVREIISEDTSLFNEKVACPNLETLDISKINVGKIWDNQSSTMCCIQNLTRLIIKDLANLRRLCSGNYIEFSSLKEMTIQNCHKLKEFIFDDKVGFPSLEKMKISFLDNLKMIWHNQLANDDSFPKLKSLEVYNCQKLLIVFPSNMHGRFLSLESLYVSDCGSLKQIFDLQGINSEERKSADHQIMISFANLQKLEVSKCQSLKNLFAASTVAKEAPAPARFLFPKLTSLKLHRLPELRSFYPDRHTMEGPVLKCLELCHCKIHDTVLVEEAVPCLERLRSAGKNVTMMWRGQVPDFIFDKLQNLEIEDDESKVLPLGIIQRFHNLEKLSLNKTSYKEIFSCEVVQTQTTARVKMKKLHLRRLKDLKYMWKQDSKLDFILQNLEVLEVRLCDSLINLIPPSASFENLTILQVDGCGSLESILTSSTAKSLVSLIEMNISHCTKITEVLGNQGDTREDRIIFSNLKSLSLHWLPCLTSFCSWNFTLEFPSLENLNVLKCPNMTIFSRGNLRVQNIQQVEIDWRSVEMDSGTDLNVAIQRFVHAESSADKDIIVEEFSN